MDVICGRLAVVLIPILFLNCVPAGATVHGVRILFTEQSSLTILRIPETVNLADGGVTEIEVEVENSGSESLNVTLLVEQDRSPHEVFPVEPLPSMLIDADSNATLVLRLLGVVWYSDLVSDQWAGSVSTAIFVRAVTADGSIHTDAREVTVHIRFLRATVFIPIVVGVMCVLVAVTCLAIRRHRRVEIV